MALPAEHDSEPSIVSALGRAVEAGQRLVINRIDLARLDALEVIDRTQRAGLLIVLGAMMAMVGWIGIGAAVVVLLQPYLSLPVSAAAVGLVSLLIGAALATAGVQYARTAMGKGEHGNGEHHHASTRWGAADGYDRV